MTYSTKEIDDLYTTNGWNEHRMRRSFTSKPGLAIVNKPCKIEEEGLHFDVTFDQIHEKLYGFRVHACVELAPDMNCWVAYLFISERRLPLHRPVEFPIKYGFTAQANQFLTAVVGLQYVYNIAGVKCLEFYPNGMAEYVQKR